MIYQINAMTITVMAVLGGVAAYMANRNIAVFNDGARPMYQSYLNNETDRKTLFATSFSLSFGLIAGFALPVSIAGRIIIVHAVFLACDLIGAFFRDDRKGMILSAFTGAAFSVLLLFGLSGIYGIFTFAPIPFADKLPVAGSLVIVIFCVFPALAIAYQTKALYGLVVLVLVILVRQAVFLYGKFTINDAEITLDADSAALFFSVIAMFITAAKVRKKSEGNTGEIFAAFGSSIERIRKNLFILAVSGGLTAAATTLLLLAEDPASMMMTSEGRYYDAALVVMSRCLGFIPLVMTTAIISGVYSPAGTKAVHIPAILLINSGLAGLAGSFVAGALIMVMEILLLGFLAKGLDRFPGMKELGDNARTAMSKVLDLALLTGGMLAANAIAPVTGFIWVAGLYFLNQNSKKPVNGMAIGPIGAITIGLLVNILHLIGLFPKN